jgi:hypothetical protein
VNRSSSHAIAVSALLLTFLLLLTGALHVDANPPQAQAIPGSSPKTAAQAFKNIQVLKDVPADQIIPSMQFISSSLGVECDFCHVEHEFDKDDKKTKKTAREMMQMMFAINKNNFEGEREVTCNTCHRGSPHPQAIPAIQAEGPKPETMDEIDHDMGPAKTSPGEPVFAKYIEALGGQSALDKITSRVEKGSVMMGHGRTAPIDIYTKQPDQRVSVMRMPQGESVTAFNGKEGWLTFPGQPVREMSSSDAESAKLDAAVFYPSHLPRLFDELKLQEHAENIDGHQASVVIGTIKGQPPVKFYFDQQTGLLVRMLHYGDTALGLNPTEVDFADYREADGVKTPYKWTLARPSGAFTIAIEQVQSNVAIDSTKFVKPPPAATPPPGAATH